MNPLFPAFYLEEAQLQQRKFTQHIHTSFECYFLSQAALRPAVARSRSRAWLALHTAQTQQRFFGYLLSWDWIPPSHPLLIYTASEGKLKSRRTSGSACLASDISTVQKSRACLQPAPTERNKRTNSPSVLSCP